MRKSARVANRDRSADMDSVTQRRTRNDAAVLRRLKKLGFSDRQLAAALASDRDRSPRLRASSSASIPAYRLVDTCAAEFEAYTPYYYSTYDDENDEVRDERQEENHDPRRRPEPHRPGHRVRLLLRPRRLRPARNSASRPSWSTRTPRPSRPTTTPATSSTSSRSRSRTCSTSATGRSPTASSSSSAARPRSISPRGLEDAGVPIIGTCVESHRARRGPQALPQMLDKLGLHQPPNGTATNEDEAVAAAADGRLSGARPPQLRPRRARHGDRLQRRRPAPLHAQRRRRLARAPRPRRPLPRRRHRGRCRLHRRRRDRRHRRDHGAHRAGRHPLRRQRLRHPRASRSPNKVKTEIRDATTSMAKELERARPDERPVRGQGRGRLRPRSQPARLAHRAVRQQGHRRPAGQARRARSWPARRSRSSASPRKSSPPISRVKEAVFPFTKFPGVDIAARPGNEIDRRSHGHRRRPRPRLRQVADGRAARRCRSAATSSSASRDADKPDIVELARGFAALGFRVYSTSGTATALEAAGIPVEHLFKLNEGRPNVLDMIKNGEIGSSSTRPPATSRARTK